MTLRALIVDDEPLARRRLRRLLADERDVEVVGECADGASALRAIRARAPDLLLLDVALPAMDGLAVLAAAGRGRVPAVVFVTAYDRYAVRAFEHDAVDYLLKPVDPARFREALTRARGRVGRGAAAELRRQLRAVIEAWRADGGNAERLFVRGRGGGVFVPVTDITWVGAARNDVVLHVGRASHRLRSTLRALETRLDPARFRRVSRSTLVNLAHVREIQPWFHGDAVAILDTGERLRVSRTYRRSLTS